MRFHHLFLAAAALSLAACGGDETTVETTDDTAVVTPAPAPPAPAPAPAPVAYDGPPAEVTLTPVGNEMRYEVTEFSVAPGQTVHLTFNNTATNPAMRHNVVVLQQGTDVNAFGQAAMTATDSDYIPPAMASQVIGHTPTSDPGQTVEVTFTAPSTPGDYTFICTFPGHYMVMQGTMHVQAQPA